VRRELDATRTPEQVTTLAACHADEATTTSLVDYLHQQRIATGIVPDERSLVVEQFRDEDELGARRHPRAVRQSRPGEWRWRGRVREWLRAGAQQRSPRRRRRSSFRCTSDDGIMRDCQAAIGCHSVLRDLTADDAQRACSTSGCVVAVRRALSYERGARCLPRESSPAHAALAATTQGADLLQAVQEFPSFRLSSRRIGRC
jgi:hypothetical protein